MGNMRIGHDIVLISNNRFPFLFGRRPVDGGIFPNHIVIPDKDTGIFAPIPDILRWRTDRNKGVYPIALTKLCMTIDHHMGSDIRILADGHIVADDTIWANPNPGSQLGVGADDR